jgi:hypothetical protein
LKIWNSVFALIERYVRSASPKDEHKQKDDHYDS